MFDRMILDMCGSHNLNVSMRGLTRGYLQRPAINASRRGLHAPRNSLVPAATVSLKLGGA